MKLPINPLLPIVANEEQPVKSTLVMYSPLNAPLPIVVTEVSIAISPLEQAQVGSQADLPPSSTPAVHSPPMISSADHHVLDQYSCFKLKSGEVPIDTYMQPGTAGFPMDPNQGMIARMAVLIMV